MNELNDSDIWDTGTRIGFSAEDSARKLTVLFPEKTAPMQNVGNEADIWKAHSMSVPRNKNRV